MELLVLLLIALLFGTATHLVLQRRLLRLIVGLFLLNHGVNLMLITMGGVKRGAAPILEPGVVDYTDPLPQALILTAIVINLGTSALLLTLAFLAYQRHGTDDLTRHGGGGAG